MKYLIGLLLGIGVTLVIVFVVLSKQPEVQVLQPSPANVTYTNLTPSDPQPTQTPQATQVASMGKISGKLCYPSSFLPAGSIEVKNVSTQTLISQSYAGTEGGQGNTFNVAVPAGTYIVRYRAVPDKNNQTNAIYGYYTDVCPSGVEPSCAASNPRKNKEVVVADNAAVTGIALCDFYYDQNTPPAF